MSMTFEKLRTVNHDRALIWHPRGLEDWSVSDWATAMAGEAGEVCNAVKKLRRIESGTVGAHGPFTREEAMTEIGKEVGDTVIYLDLLATRLGFSLEDLVRIVFNGVSDREGFAQRL